MQSSKDFEDAKAKMQECQKTKGFVKQYNEIEYTTCEPCSELIGCEIRKKYVDLVYLSMSGGDEGGFEF